MTCVDCGRPHERRCTPRCCACASTRAALKRREYNQRYQAGHAVEVNAKRRRKYLVVAIAQTEAKLARLRAQWESIRG